MPAHYTSGNWLVKEGSEDAFIEAWTAFTGWSRENAAGAGEFVLIRSESEPRAFVSFGEWDSTESAYAWRDMPEFPELLGRCRALCDEFEANDYTQAAAVGR
jgi:heme-degrading monooxygenase HmoA